MEKLLTADDIRNILQIGSTSFWRLCKSKGFPPPTINISRKLQRWNQDDVQAFLRGEYQPPKAA